MIILFSKIFFESREPGTKDLAKARAVSNAHCIMTTTPAPVSITAKIHYRRSS